MGTRIDPTLCRADRLVGQVLGLKGRLPEIYTELEISFYLLKRLLGVKVSEGQQAKVEKLTKSEILMANIASSAVGCKVAAIKKDAAKLVLPQSCVHNGRREDRTEQTHRQALAPDRLGDHRSVSPTPASSSFRHTSTDRNCRGKIYKLDS